MERRSRRKVGARRYADYSQETLNIAIELVKSKALSSYEAEKQFGIPRRTILNKCNNTHVKAIGRPQELSADIEKHIADVVEVAADFGSPLTILDLRIVVYNYLAKCGMTDLFNGRMPGERWARNYLKRHKFTQRATQNIKRSRASKTVEEMTAFYENLESSLKDVPCENILNFDETNLSDDPGSTKAIFKRGTKHPERVLNSSKSSVSIMFSGTADGQCLPPYVVYKAEHLWSRWCEFGPQNARYNRTKSGWFDMVCFDDWFKTIILPWATLREGQKVIIGDNLASHLSVEVVKLCQENNIKLVFLPPNATHLTQPLDVAFFGPMKKCWRKILLSYKITHQNSNTLNKCDFPRLLKELMTKINMSNNSNICSGFAGSGIFPFNPSRVINKIPVVSTEEKKNFDVSLLEYLQKIRSQKTQSKTEANKKLQVVSGQSISTEEAENMTKNKVKGKGKGKTTKKKTINTVLDTASLPVLQQPKSLKELSIQLVNKFLLQDKTVIFRRNKTQTTNVRLISQVSKTDNENLPFIALCKDNLPSSLQTPKIIACRSGNLSKTRKDTGIKILSDEIIKPGTTNTFGKANTRADLKYQHTKSETKRKRITSARNRSVLRTILIPKSEENVIKLRNVKQQRYKTKNASAYSDSTTSVSDDMSEHSDSTLMDIESEGEDNSEDFSLYSFKRSNPSAISNNYSGPVTAALVHHDDQISNHVESSENDYQAYTAKVSPHCAIVPNSPKFQTNDPTKSDKIDLSDSKISQNPFQSEPRFSQDQGGVSAQEKSFSTVTRKSKTTLIQSISDSDGEQSSFEYAVNDKVLVRYYMKNKWKYYIGVITSCNIDLTFDVSFYTTTCKKGELKFKKPKKIDRDTISKMSIEKIIKIDKLSDKPEEYKLHDEEDATYF